MSIIGENIRHLRERIGMRLDFFAKTIGVTPATVINWESDRSIPRPAKIKAICDFFNIRSVPQYLDLNLDPDYLLNKRVEVKLAELDARKLDKGRNIHEYIHFVNLSKIFFDDEKLVNLMQVTDDERIFLRGIRFDRSFVPPKQFYIDILYHYRNSKQNGRDKNEIDTLSKT